jgi:hypothetical protein
MTAIDAPPTKFYHRCALLNNLSTPIFGFTQLYRKPPHLSRSVALTLFRTMSTGSFLVGAGPCVINVGTFERLNVGTFNVHALFLGKHQEKLRKAKGERRKNKLRKAEGELRNMEIPNLFNSAIFNPFSHFAIRNSQSPCRGRPPCLPCFWATTGGCPYKRSSHAQMKGWLPCG